MWVQFAHFKKKKSLYFKVFGTLTDKVRTEDFLIESNRKYRDFLISQGVEHTYVEDKGIHDWNFWDEYIEKALEWLMKL